MQSQEANVKDCSQRKAEYTKPKILSTIMTYFVSTYRAKQARQAVTATVANAASSRDLISTPASEKFTIKAD